MFFARRHQSPAVAATIDGDDPIFLKGIQLYNHGEYFEAHETWEGCWKDRWDEEKRFVQGLIQVAAGYEKYKWAEADQVHFKGCLQLLDMGLEKLRDFPDVHWGVPVRELIEKVVETRTRMAEMAQTKWRLISLPKIHQVRGPDGRPLETTPRPAA